MHFGEYRGAPRSSRWCMLTRRTRPRWPAWRLQTQEVSLISLGNPQPAGCRQKHLELTRHPPSLNLLHSPCFQNWAARFSSTQTFQTCMRRRSGKLRHQTGTPPQKNTAQARYTKWVTYQRSSRNDDETALANRKLLFLAVLESNLSKSEWAGGSPGHGSPVPSGHQGLASIPNSGSSVLRLPKLLRR